MTNPSTSPSKLNRNDSISGSPFYYWGDLKGTSRDRLYQEIGVESLADRRWSRKICFIHKIALIPCRHTFSHL